MVDLTSAFFHCHQYARMVEGDDSRTVRTSSTLSLVRSGRPADLTKAVLSGFQRNWSLFANFGRLSVPCSDTA